MVGELASLSSSEELAAFAAAPQREYVVMRLKFFGLEVPLRPVVAFSLGMIRDGTWAAAPNMHPSRRAS